MIFKKGFLLIEFMIGLFLLSLCITFFISQYAHIGSITAASLQMHQKLMIAQSALEKARLLKKEFYESYTIDTYTVEAHAINDHILKNFLHITVTLYDKEGKKEVWSSGVAISNE